MLYSLERPIEQKRCQICGQSFLDFCESCGTPLKNVFRSHNYFMSPKPTNTPTRPDHCTECGDSFPWKGNPDVDNKLLKELWDLIHPTVVSIARKRFEDGHYADAVLAALKILNSEVKKIYKHRTGEEFDGVTLMRRAFSLKRPIIVLDDIGTDTGKNIQQGYMDLFAGAMAGIRNPKAHEVIEIDAKRAIHHLFLVSLLFFKLDEEHGE